MAKVVSVKMVNNSDEVLEDVRQKINGWLEAIGQDAATTAANVLTQTDTIDTGRLKNSIDKKVVEEEQAVYIGTNVEYAIWHEIGTGKFVSGGRKGGWSYMGADGEWHFTEGVPAKHFLQFGVTAHQDEYKDLLERTLRE